MVLARQFGHQRDGEGMKTGGKTAERVREVSGENFGMFHWEVAISELSQQIIHWIRNT